MNTNEQFRNERQAFDELVGDDRFDDSLSDQHQSELRSEMLQAFDRPSSEIAVVQQHVPSVGARQLARRKRSLGFTAIVAVCLIGLVAVWTYRGDRSSDGGVVQQPDSTDVTEDPQLLESLAEVNAFRDEVSREALFDAIAMCELDHEGRMLFGEAQPR